MGDGTTSGPGKRSGRRPGLSGGRSVRLKVQVPTRPRTSWQVVWRDGLGLQESRLLPAGCIVGVQGTRIDQ